MRRFVRRAVPILALALAAQVRAATPFTFVVEPDTQYYTLFSGKIGEWNAQNNWIVANQSSLNIPFVFHMGDLVQDGDPFNLDGSYSGNITPSGQAATVNGAPNIDSIDPTNHDFEVEWKRADAAMKILDDANIPYSTVPGNHDYYHWDQKKYPTEYLKFFGPQRYTSKPTFGGSSPVNTNQPANNQYAGLNTYHLFTAGGKQFLNLALQYQPDQYDLAWAQSVIDAHPGVPTIISTHEYLQDSEQDSTATATSTPVSQINPGHSPAGQKIWDGLVNNNDQIFMVLSGHWERGNANASGRWNQVSYNSDGRPVYELFSDYQEWSDSAGFKAGNGYLRTLQFDLDNNKLDVKTYSPYANKSLTSPLDQYSYNIDFANRLAPAPATPPTVATTTFQQGVNGFSGAKDTYITRTSSTDTGLTQVAHANDSVVWVDKDDVAKSTANPSQGLLRFDDLFGADSGQIPQGAQITSAKLTIFTATTSFAEASGHILLYRMLQDWNPSADAWAGLGAYPTQDDIKSLALFDVAGQPKVNGGSITLDVTAALQAWAGGEANFGWVLLNDNIDGWQFDSSDFSDPTKRPQLSVSYIATVPEPGALAMIALAIPLLRSRRPRRA